MQYKKIVRTILGVLLLVGGYKGAQALNINNTSFQTGRPIFKTIFFRSEGKDKIAGATNPEGVRLDTGGVYIAPAALPGVVGDVLKLITNQVHRVKIVGSDIGNYAITNNHIQDLSITNTSFADYSIENNHFMNITLETGAFASGIVWPTGGNTMYYTHNLCPAGQAMTGITNGTGTCATLPTGAAALPTCAPGEILIRDNVLGWVCGAPNQASTGINDLYRTGHITGDIHTIRTGNVGIGLNGKMAPQAAKITHKLSVSGDVNVLGSSEDQVYCYANNTWVPLSQYNASACAGCPVGSTLNPLTNLCEKPGCFTTGCGNGVIEAPEQCDDANNINNDSCDNNCNLNITGGQIGCLTPGVVINTFTVGDVDNFNSIVTLSAPRLPSPNYLGYISTYLNGIPAMPANGIGNFDTQNSDQYYLAEGAIPRCVNGRVIRCLGMEVKAKTTGPAINTDSLTLYTKNSIALPASPGGPYTRPGFSSPFSASCGIDQNLFTQFGTGNNAYYINVSACPNNVISAIAGGDESVYLFGADDHNPDYVNLYGGYLPDPMCCVDGNSCSSDADCGGAANSCDTSSNQCTCGSGGGGGGHSCVEGNACMNDTQCDNIPGSCGALSPARCACNPGAVCIEGHACVDDTGCANIPGACNMTNRSCECPTCVEGNRCNNDGDCGAGICNTTNNRCECGGGSCTPAAACKFDSDCGGAPNSCDNTKCVCA